MNLNRIKDLPRETLLELLEMAYRNFRTIDGLWFLEVEEAHGVDAATEVDSKVWERMASFEVRRLRKALRLEREGIPGLVEALENSMCWMSFAGEFQVEQVDEKRAVFRVMDCLPQKTRVEQQIGLFPCRAMEQRYLGSFARAVDPSIKVSCGFSPPDEPRGRVWCEWWFELE